MLQFIAGGLSLAQGIFGYRSAKKQAKRKARMIRQMSKYNAEVKEMEARSIARAMEAETTRAYKQKRKGISTQRAAYAKTGAISAGTPMSVMIDQALEMELDIQDQRRNRLLEIQNKRQQATMTRYEGEVGAQTAKIEGRAASRQSLLSGFAGAVAGFGAGIKGVDQAKFDKTYQKGTAWKY
tara:strand:+ start:2350 stop:2895 length:546 start_codon:yes stop_codon:yes gene_type:complete